METIVEKRMPGMPDRLLAKIVKDAECHISIDDELDTLTLHLPDGSTIQGKNNTHLVLAILKALIKERSKCQ